MGRRFLTRTRNDRRCLRQQQQASWHSEHIKVFATTDAAETWFEENDAEGAAFEYELLE
jgi:hypothetical protein